MTKTVYNDASGVWTNGVTPLSAANMEPIRDFLTATGAMWDSNASWDGNGILTLLGLAINPTGTVLNGATSGTATLYAIMQGTVKFYFISTVNFRNGGGSGQNMALPVAFTTEAWFWTGDINTISMLASGSAVTARLVTSLGSPSGGFTNNTSIGGPCWGQVGAFDTVQFQGSIGSAHTGPILLIGV